LNNPGVPPCPAKNGEDIGGEIVEEMPLAQSTVSQHLKILKETGLVQGEIDRPRVCYCINKDALEKLKKLISEL
jgi:ArsR family transcriptional regulator